ncbi:hypothetical protein B0H13DRAFT_2360582 [Mycena leptocephala]|nr:hypothetical protein B0H13DRAFT_2360582 [Mycena leptocephala]
MSIHSRQEEEEELSSASSAGDLSADESELEDDISLELLEQEARLKEGTLLLILLLSPTRFPAGLTRFWTTLLRSILRARHCLICCTGGFYRWMPRMGRLRAALRVSKNHGRGPASQRVLCTQARFFEANGALKPTHQGHRAKQYGLLDDEGFYMGVQRWLRTLEVGRCAKKHVNETLLPSLSLKKTSISIRQCVYWDGRERKDVKKRRKEYLAELEALDPFRAKYAEPDMAEILLEATLLFPPIFQSVPPTWSPPTSVVLFSSVWERRLGTQLGLHSEYGPHIDGNGILSFITNVCATMAVRYIGKTWFRFADAANAQQAVGMLAEEVWGEVSNDTAVASVAEIEEVEAEVQRTLEIARFLAGPVTQAMWPTMLLDPFFHLPNLRDGWDHLGSAHSLEVMSLTSMMQRSLLPNVLNNRARDMMLQLLARLHPTEELDAVLEFIEYVGGFRSAPLY